MQANSAILKGLFVAQVCMSDGSRGRTTGDHRSSTMKTKPGILHLQEYEQLVTSGELAVQCSLQWH